MHLNSQCTNVHVSRLAVDSVTVQNMFNEPAMDVALTEEVGGSLRAMKVAKSGAVKDRISSVYRRGLLELPPQSGVALNRRLAKRQRKQQRSRKFVSPLMRESLKNM